MWDRWIWDAPPTRESQRCCICWVVELYGFCSIGDIYFHNLWIYSSILHWEKTSEGSAQVANSRFTRWGHWRAWQKFLVVEVKTFHESPTSRYMWLIFDTFEYPNGFVSTMRHGTSSKIHGFHNDIELFGRPLVSHWFLDIPKYPGKHCIYIHIYIYCRYCWDNSLATVQGKGIGIYIHHIIHTSLAATLHRPGISRILNKWYCTVSDSHCSTNRHQNAW